MSEDVDQPRTVAIDRRFAERFDRRYGPGAAEELGSMLAKDCTTLAGVARKFGFSNEYARQINNRYCLGSLPARRKRRICTLGKPHIRRFPETTLFVWRAARQAGLDVTFLNIVDKGHVRTLSHGLVINGFACKIHELRTFITSKGSGVKYANMSVRGSRITAHSFHLGVCGDDVWVVPTDTTRGRPSISLPYYDAGCESYAGRRWSPFKNFKNAWGLLQNKKGEARTDAQA